MYKIIVGAIAVFALAGCSNNAVEPTALAMPEAAVAPEFEPAPTPENYEQVPAPEDEPVPEPEWYINGWTGEKTLDLAPPPESDYRLPDIVTDPAPDPGAYMLGVWNGEIPLSGSSGDRMDQSGRDYMCDSWALVDEEYDEYEMGVMLWMMAPRASQADWLNFIVTQC